MAFNKRRDRVEIIRVASGFSVIEGCVQPGYDVLEVTHACETFESAVCKAAEIMEIDLLEIAVDAGNGPEHS